MNINKWRSGGLAILIAATGTFGLAACASDADSSDSPDTEATEEVVVDVAQDLETARTAVEDALADDPSWAQVMLAGDVEAPTQKYGLLVMPFVATDAVSHVTGTVTIDDGDYVIEAESAASGQVWQINQDGEISEVTE